MRCNATRARQHSDWSPDFGGRGIAHIALSLGSRAHSVVRIVKFCSRLDPMRVVYGMNRSVKAPAAGTAGTFESLNAWEACCFGATKTTVRPARPPHPWLSPDGVVGGWGLEFKV